MTVEELIKQLQKYPKDYLVELSMDWSYDGYCKDIDIMSKEGIVIIKSKED